YRNIGFELVACRNRTEARGREFAQRWGAEYISDYRSLCGYPGLGFVDVCTFPEWHLEAVEACAEAKRPVQVQKPIATNLEAARQIMEVARAADIPLGVASQHRFDDATIFLKRALAAGRLGKLLQGDAYVKWWRNEEYYSRPIKGSWQTEGGGALINQAIHQIDLLLYLAGPLAAVAGIWQLGARHKIESEDIVNALLQYRSGATGVIQAATAFWPGYSERVELHGTKGAAVITGDRLTQWDVLGDEEANAADPAPIAQNVSSGSSEPMAIAVTSFERQFVNFAEAIRSGRKPLVDGEEGYRALEAVLGVYQSCKERRWVEIAR
ncbi:MAG: Gfo/Idh/MocA family protein, partial [Bryobacteraceae bacterium]